MARPIRRGSRPVRAAVSVRAGFLRFMTPIPLWPADAGRTRARPGDFAIHLEHLIGDMDLKWFH